MSIKIIYLSTFAAVETPVIAHRVSEICHLLPTVMEEVKVRSDKPRVKPDDNISMTGIC